MNDYSHRDKAEIEALLVGHKLAKISKDTLTLDDGRQLKFVGNDGGCSCYAGCYDLKELNGVDNIITAVEFVDRPNHETYDEDDDGGEGVYRIFVFADNQRINLATFEGSDGNGYYGTGYSIEVTVPA